VVDIDILLEEDIEGDFMEFGVDGGGSFTSILEMMAYKKLFDTKRVFGFDSWEGLPEEAVGVEIYSSWIPGFFKTSYDEFKARIGELMKKRNIPEEKVIIIKGLFKDTLTEQFKKDYNITKIAFVNIDVDLYISCKEVLEFIRPLLHKGTVIRFDDWTIPTQGEWKAWNEFIEKYPFLYEKMTLGGNEQIIKIL
jgi:hypothetical protein